MMSRYFKYVAGLESKSLKKVESFHCHPLNQEYPNISGLTVPLKKKKKLLRTLLEMFPLSENKQSAPPPTTTSGATHLQHINCKGGIMHIFPTSGSTTLNDILLKTYLLVESEIV